MLKVNTAMLNYFESWKMSFKLGLCLRPRRLSRIVESLYLVDNGTSSGIIL